MFFLIYKGVRKRVSEKGGGSFKWCKMSDMTRSKVYTCSGFST